VNLGPLVNSLETSPSCKFTVNMLLTWLLTLPWPPPLPLLLVVLPYLYEH
jgi:hypothetical protein